MAHRAPIVEGIMTSNRVAVASLALGVAAVFIVEAAHADNRAAQKLGQIGVINQTLQPKPPKSSPGGYSNSPNTNAPTPGYTGNTAINANAANAANSANAAANARAGATMRNGK
ncbi:hypothetical protein BG57_10865 [Caballeronia grimmiae]|uniref:Uncharacterized protein n=2 Tax=Caballeronia grimmiae TaxID=1071679 RepID=A0A069P878_9BURK|nr:hypothetical protein BG57_10865 [Caballeronia grimmiae]